MPAWNEYKAIAKERGALALELYVVETKPKSSPEAVKENLPKHLEYQRELEQRGVLVLAGPTSDATGESMEGAGMIVIETKNDAARASTTDVAIGPTKSPIAPGNRNTGMKPRIVVSVDASNGTKRCDSALRRAWRRSSPASSFFLTSSVITIALSIRSPIAMIMPKIDI